jgi:sec-independent protein translocase protein TatA
MLIAEILGPDLIIVIVVAVVVLLFGGSKLPKLARGLGSASHEFKKGLEEGAADSKTSTAAQPTAIPSVAPPTSVPPSVGPSREVDGIPKDSNAS